MENEKRNLCRTLPTRALSLNVFVIFCIEYQVHLKELKLVMVRTHVYSTHTHAYLSGHLGREPMYSICTMMCVSLVTTGRLYLRLKERELLPLALVSINKGGRTHHRVKH